MAFFSDFGFLLDDVNLLDQKSTAIIRISISVVFLACWGRHFMIGTPLQPRQWRLLKDPCTGLQCCTLSIVWLKCFPYASHARSHIAGKPNAVQDSGWHQPCQTLTAMERGLWWRA